MDLVSTAIGLLDADGPEKEAWRLDLPSQALGLTPPPCDVRIWPASGTEADLATTPGRLDVVGRWLRQHADADLVCEGGLAEETALVRFRRLPDPLHRLLDAVCVEAIGLSPAGAASIFVRGTQASVEKAAASLDAGPDAVHLRPATRGLRPELSRTQRQAVQLAMALGYYDVPRRTDLRGMAARLGITHGALSEVLRRGEQHIIAAFCDGWMTRGETGSARPEAGSTRPETESVRPETGSAKPWMAMVARRATVSD